MRRLVQLAAVSLALACQAPANAATPAGCPINEGPIATASTGARMLIVGGGREGGKSRLVSCLVQRNGRLASEPRALTRFTGRPAVQATALAYNRKLREYLLVSSAKGRLRMHRLSRGGGAGDLGTPLPRFRGQDASDADVACSPKTGRCLIGWVSGGSQPAIAGFRVRPGGKTVDRRPFSIAGPDSSLGGGAAVVARGRTFVTAWAERDSGVSRLRARVVPSTGRARDPFAFYSTSTKRISGRPALAAAGSRRVGAVWAEDGDLRLVVGSLGSQGPRVDPALVTLSGGNSDPALAYPGGRRGFDVAWRRGGNVFSRTVQFDQVRVVGTTHCLSCGKRSGRGKAGAPGLARLGTRSFATWFAPRRVFIARAP